MRPNLLFESQAKADFVEVVSNNYNEAKSQRLLGLYESLSLQRRNYFIRANVRFEQPVKERILTLPSLNLGFAPISKLPKTWIFANISYNVRFPSFNELYWQNVGNPDLKEETSRAVELGLDQEITSNKLNVKFLSTLFFNDVRQMIVWIPENGLWSPKNISAVRNRGLEVEVKTMAKLKHGTLFMNAGYVYTSSTIMENEEYPETIGKQQVYTPKHKAQIALNLEWKSNFISFSQVFTGRTYINSDNHTYIPFSTPVNLALGRKFEVKESLFTAKVGVRNLFDEDYQYVAHMPMPKRNYYLSILFHFNHIKS
jgi:iron complex outermembrane receptor protein